MKQILFKTSLHITDTQGT